MKKYTLLFAYFILTLTCYSQVGIGTTTPNGTLEVTSGNDAKLGLVLPIVAKLEDVENTIAGEPVKKGTIVFDEQRNTLCHKTNNGWSCLNGDTVPDPPPPPGPIDPTAMATYIKASNTDVEDFFGNRVALSADGNTLAVGASGESSNATGINGDQTDNSARGAGAVYVFTRSGTTWTQQAYIKASNADVEDSFGRGLALSADGNTLAVSAIGESSNATGINGNQTNDSVPGAGAVYVFTRSGTTWAQQAYIKASNNNTSSTYGSFGFSVALSADGNTLAVGTVREFVEVFIRNGTAWLQQAYIIAANSDTLDQFGNFISLSGEGNTLAVGAWAEDSNATGVNGDQTDNSTNLAGAVYVFTRSGSTWTQQAYVKASNTKTNSCFGRGVVLSGDGNTLAVGSYTEASNATGINGDQTDNSTNFAGAVYVFTRSGTTWAQQVYIKASNTDASDFFGETLAISVDGNAIAVSATGESSNATGINGNQVDNSVNSSGAVYYFTRNGTTWSQQAYIKASNPSISNMFGGSLALSANGNILVAGALQESSNATGIGGNQTNNLAPYSGAVYVYELRQ